MSRCSILHKTLSAICGGELGVRLQRGFTLKRVILMIELLILCGPATAMLCIGFLYSPVWVFGSVSGSGEWSIGLFMTICGTWGLISLSNLSWSVIAKSRKWSGRKIQWIGIVLGISACLTGLVTLNDREIMLLIFTGPIIATLHLLYLNKNTDGVS